MAPGKKQKTQKEAMSAFIGSWEKAAEAARAREQNSAGAAANADSTSNDEILNDVPATVQQNFPSAPMANVSEAHSNDFDDHDMFDAEDEGSVVSCDEMGNEPVSSNPTSRARATTNNSQSKADLACMELLKRHVANEDTDAPLRGLEAVAMAEYVHRGLNLGCRLRAVTFRHVVTPFFINAITESNLQLHSPDPKYPLGLNSRHKYHYESAATIEERRALVREANSTSRVHVRTVIDDAICTLTQAGPNYLSCVSDIDTIFKTAGDASHGLASKRWAMLFSLFEEGSPPREALVEERKTKLLRNAGNANAHHTAQEEVEKNCKVFRRIMDMGIGRYLPKKEGLFLLPDDSRPIPDDMPPELPLSPFVENPKYPVFRMKFEAVKSRLRKLPEGNTNQHKAVRWEDIDDGIVKTKRKITSCIRRTHKKGKNPVYTIKYEGYVLRLCYLEVDKILTDEGEEEEI